MHFTCIFYKLITLVRAFLQSHLEIRVDLCPSVHYLVRKVWHTFNEH